jgi:hypothetical protein
MFAIGSVGQSDYRDLAVQAGMPMIVKGEGRA